MVATPVSIETEPDVIWADEEHRSRAWWLIRVHSLVPTCGSLSFGLLLIVLNSVPREEATGGRQHSRYIKEERFNFLETHWFLWAALRIGLPTCVLLVLLFGVLHFKHAVAARGLQILDALGCVVLLGEAITAAVFFFDRENDTGPVELLTFLIMFLLFFVCIGNVLQAALCLVATGQLTMMIALLCGERRPQVPHWMVVIGYPASGAVAAINPVQSEAAATVTVPVSVPTVVGVPVCNTRVAQTRKTKE